MTYWYKCPLCRGKLLKLRKDTVIRNLPAYCKHCKKESLITIEPMSRTVKD